jgi:hypothetical protein
MITYEVRIASGYGVRWRLPDVSFRGFLEPQMEGNSESCSHFLFFNKNVLFVHGYGHSLVDGHEKGWIH